MLGLIILPADEPTASALMRVPPRPISSSPLPLFAPSPLFQNGTA